MAAKAGFCSCHFASRYPDFSDDTEFRLQAQNDAALVKAFGGRRRLRSVLQRQAYRPSPDVLSEQVAGAQSRAVCALLIGHQRRFHTDTHFCD